MEQPGRPRGYLWIRGRGVARRGARLLGAVWLIAVVTACGDGGAGGSASTDDTLEILTLTQRPSPSGPVGDGELDVDPLRQGSVVGDQIPVIFIHGFDFPLGGRSPRQQMDDMIADLTRRVADWDGHFQAWLYVYDPLQHLAESAAELAGELHRRAYEGPVVLVGYSEGGLVARSFDTQFGEEFPVAKLIMIATPNGGLPLEAMKGMLLEDINRLPDPLPTTLIREVARVIYREVFDEREAAEDLVEGSEFLAGLAPPSERYYAYAGIGSDTNLFLDYVSNLDLYADLPNDGLVSVESVEAGLIPGRTAEISPGGGYLDNSHLSIVRALEVFAAIAERLQAPF
jgi:pimeloyl-ACP methyl ester carboxylesterase